VKAVEGDWSTADWAPDETQLVAIQAVSINESYVHRVDLKGKSELLTPPPADPAAPRVAYGDVRWSRDGKALYWTTDRDSEYLRLARHPLDGGADTVLSGDVNWDVEEFAVSDDGAIAAYLTNEAGRSVVRAVDLATGKPRAMPPTPSGVLNGLEFRPGTHELGMTLSAAQAASDAYTLDLAAPDGKPIRWTESETGGQDPKRFTEPELVAVDSFDGQRITAYVYRPDPQRFPGKRPVLMNIHGGPESQFRPSFLGRANHLVNELGIVLIYPNVRGSAGYGKTFLKLDNGMKRQDSVKDIGALLDWIAAQPDLDDRRVGVTGGSYGGFMSLAVQTTYPGRIRAGIDTVGISNFVTFLTNTQGYRRDLRRVEYGDERDPAMRAFLETVSPLNRADQIRNPLLVVQGQNDPRVPISEADQVVAAVRNNGVPVWYVVGTNEGHGFAKKANQDYLQAVELTFLRRFLLGDDSPGASPSGAEAGR
jgi:dipeptidyl aminopeptidase/acylaminoacyl peptidase